MCGTISSAVSVSSDFILEPAPADNGLLPYFVIRVKLSDLIPSNNALYLITVTNPDPTQDGSYGTIIVSAVGPVFTLYPLAEYTTSPVAASFALVNQTSVPSNLDPFATGISNTFPSWPGGLYRFSVNTAGALSLYSSQTASYWTTIYPSSTVHNNYLELFDDGLYVTGTMTPSPSSTPISRNLIKVANKLKAYSMYFLDDGGIYFYDANGVLLPAFPGNAQPPVTPGPGNFFFSQNKTINALNSTSCCIVIKNNSTIPQQDTYKLTVTQLQ